MATLRDLKRSDIPAIVAELIGTAVLVGAVIGSGIMAVKLTDDVGLQLLINALATVAALGVLVVVLLPVSGAHINPAVTLVLLARRDISATLAGAYIAVQLLGGFLGAVLAHAMFEVDLVSWSSAERTGWGQWLGEVVATAGLVLVVLRAPRSTLAVAIAAWIGAAYFFTSSTSFANPAVAFGRAFTDSFAGIAWEHVPAFVVAQLIGAAVGLGLGTLFRPQDP